MLNDIMFAINNYTGKHIEFTEPYTQFTYMNYDFIKFAIRN